jgi:DNA-binding transcriptional LysR family regulator
MAADRAGQLLGAGGFGGRAVSVLSEHTLAASGADDLAVLDVAGFPIETRWFLVHLREKKLSPVAAAFMRHALAAQAKPDYRAAQDVNPTGA